MLLCLYGRERIDGPRILFQRCPYCFNMFASLIVYKCWVLICNGYFSLTPTIMLPRLDPRAVWVVPAGNSTLSPGRKIFVAFLFDIFSSPLRITCTVCSSCVCSPELNPGLMGQIRRLANPSSFSFFIHSCSVILFMVYFLSMVGVNIAELIKISEGEAMFTPKD